MGRRKHKALDELEGEILAMEVNELLVWDRNDLNDGSVNARVSRMRSSDFDVVKFSRNDKFYFVRIK